MRTSPRKKGRSRKEVDTPPQPTSKPKRQPARCHKCPNKPLRSECEHGRKKSADLSQGEQGAGSPDAPTAPTAPTAPASLPATQPAVSGHHFGPYAFAAGAGGYTQNSQLDPLATPVGFGPFQGAGFAYHPMYHQQLVPGALGHGVSPSFGQGVIPVGQGGPPQVPLAGNVAGAPPPYAGHGTIPTGQAPPQNPVTGNVAHPPIPSQQSPALPIDPNLLAPTQAGTTAQPTGLSLPDAEADDADFETESEAESESNVGGSKNQTQRKKKRIYASNRNPVYGYIEGVGRGNRLLKMARRCKLKPVYTDQKKATSNWRRLTQDFLTRAEDISNRTASWLYVALHNPSAGQPFTHFASRRMRMEAPEDLQKIHQEVASLMTVLKRADRAQNIQYEKEKEQVILEAASKVDKAIEEAQKAQSEAQQLREELDARDKLLREIYGAAYAAT